MFNHAIAYVLSVVAAETREEKGATAVEYGLLVALIAGAIIVAVTALGGTISGLFDGITGQL